MKKSSIKLLVAAWLVLLTSPAFAIATIVETVQLDFASGGQFNGTITFNDGYEGMIATSGTLTGGSNSYNDVFSWTWWLGRGQANPNDSNGDGYYNDWLMDGVLGGAYDNYIGLSWDENASTLNNALTLNMATNSYYNGLQNYNGVSDLIVGYSDGSGSVPEPATLALLGLGLAGMGFSRRKKVS